MLTRRRRRFSVVGAEKNFLKFDYLLLQKHMHEQSNKRLYAIALAYCVGYPLMILTVA